AQQRVQVRPHLSKHAAGFPPVENLLACIQSGNRERGIAQIGAGRDTAGSAWIIRAADRADSRPLNVTIWGGQTDFAQALWRVREDRGPDGVRSFIKKLRVYDINDQDKIQSWLFENFPDLFYVLASAEPGRDKREGVYRGMYLGGDESLTSLAWLDEHVRQNHGPLGALYPAKTWTAPNPHSALKEGDTPSWFYFRPSGLQDPSEPGWGGFGGRFKQAERGLWRDAADFVDGKSDVRAAVWRWRDIWQRDFQARMDWCVQETKNANHAPAVVIDGAAAARPLDRKAVAGQPLTVSASASDPDGHRVQYKWWIYADAGTYRGLVKVRSELTAAATVEIPPDAAGKTLHLILEATDNGTPPLTTPVRIVIRVD
ncbi:MAG TPA: nucleoside hydrolase-like domain-containing protein, partial [Pirellulaceae bacterium]|nr:nucleoside hydrolase-like domain-containing protein [Pirellulaceae bacterium]